MPGNNEDSVSPTSAGGAPRRSPTIRARLLLTVNAVLLVLLTALLVTDYRYQLTSPGFTRLAENFGNAWLGTRSRTFAAAD